MPKAPSTCTASAGSIAPGVMTAIYRMTKDGLTGEQAFKEMKQYQVPGPDFLHPEFKKFVYQFRAEGNCRGGCDSSSQQ